MVCIKVEYMVSDPIEPMVELVHCSHRTVYTDHKICWDPKETERSKATIPRWRKAPDTPGESLITVTTGSKRPGTVIHDPITLYWQGKGPFLGKAKAVRELQYLAIYNIIYLQYGSVHI